MEKPLSIISTRSYDAVIFDLDGVITKTASVQAAAWKKLFDNYLEQRAQRLGKELDPFDIDKDYRLYVDGKPRFDGVKSFLESRGIELSQGSPEDGSDRETMHGLGNKKIKYSFRGSRWNAKSFPLRCIIGGRKRKALRETIKPSSKKCRIGNQTHRSLKLKVWTR